MIFPVDWTTRHLLLTSIIPLNHNAVKNILFRISSLLLQYTVLKLLAYIACRSSTYTSFLMLGEDLIQKFYYLSAHGVTRQTWIVLAFAVLFPIAGLYDTWLWLLDSPGFISQSAPIDAPTLSSYLLPDTSYLITIPGTAAAGINLERILSTNIYSPGINASLVGTHLPLAREVTSPLRNLSINTHPRLWLDDEGWSIGSDLAPPSLPNGAACATRNQSEIRQTWACMLNNTTDGYNLFAKSVGEPRIWWNNFTMEPDIIVPFHKENIWHTLGPFGNSAAMKQIFMITKGQRRHTFIESSWKVSMTNTPPMPLQDREILDLVRRMWNKDANQVVNPEIQEVIDQIMLARAEGNSFTKGTLAQEPFTILSSIIEFLTVVNPTNSSNTTPFSTLRIRSSNVTLLRSELLPPSSIHPFTSCPIPFANVATGGLVRDTTCNRHPITSDTLSGQNGPLVGQIDSSTVVILSGIFGEGNTNTSESVFDPQGLRWLTRNDARLDELMASRAFILGGNDNIVQLNLQGFEPAISYLQLILVVIPLLLAAIAFTLMIGNSTSHYKHSFLAAVCATTHISDNSCRRIGYLKVPPLLSIKALRRHLVIGTPDEGTLMHVGPDQVVASSMVTEPFNLPPSNVSSEVPKPENGNRDMCA